MLTMSDLRVTDIMTPCPHSLTVDATLGDAVEFVRARGLSGVPVVDTAGKLVGVITLTDLVDALAPGLIEGAVGDPTLRQLITRPPATTTEQTAVSAACRQMIQEHVHRLIVVRDGEPVGVLSAIDAVRAIACLDDLAVTQKGA